MMAAIQDYRCSKVSNVLIYLGYSISFMYQCIMNNKCFLYWFFDSIIPVMILFLFFYLKMLGAADIKLISVLSGFYGWRLGLRIFAISIVYGAVWSMFKLYRHRNLAERLAYLRDYFNSIIILKKRIPYLRWDSSSNSYTIPFSVVILLAAITQCLLQ